MYLRPDATYDTANFSLDVPPVVTPMALWGAPAIPWLPACWDRSKVGHSTPGKCEFKIRLTSNNTLANILDAYLGYPC